jgi:hypothetical protein
MMRTRLIGTAGFSVTAVLCTAVMPAAATDYFSMDAKTIEFSPELLGPSTQFAPSLLAPSTAMDTASTLQPPGPKTAGIAESHRSAVHMRTAARRHRNPLSAYASYSRLRVRACTAGGVCVWDGKLKRWRAP